MVTEAKGQRETAKKLKKEQMKMLKDPYAYRAERYEMAKKRMAKADEKGEDFKRDLDAFAAEVKETEAK